MESDNRQYAVDLLSPRRGPRMLVLPVLRDVQIIENAA
jgi:hypothetical protein